LGALQKKTECRKRRVSKAVSDAPPLMGPKEAGDRKALGKGRRLIEKTACDPGKTEVTSW